MSKSIFLLVLAGLFSLQANAQIKLQEGQPSIEQDRILLEANDAGEEISIPRDEWDSNALKSGYFDFKKSFSEVARVITPEVENAFDLFVFVNVSYERYGSPNDFIPSQRLKVFRRAFPGQRVFKRNGQGNIVSYDPVYADVLGTSSHQPALPGIDAEMKISSGASQRGKGYVDTFSGVFRVNHKKSLAKRYGEGMLHSLYVDVLYPKGSSSGIAVHGTPKSNYGALGSQASHGCVRTRIDFAKKLYEFVLSEPMYDVNLLDFNRYERLPPAPLKDPRPGYKALFVFFYGYNDKNGVAL
ncbi:MAG: L,D-transpeptidase [Bdellovibrionales bacterium]|nr:L,D-transpeptidase [Bdellovibrionales bacterium]